jgi:hypothetical protein
MEKRWKQFLKQLRVGWIVSELEVELNPTPEEVKEALIGVRKDAVDYAKRYLEKENKWEATMIALTPKYLVRVIYPLPNTHDERKALYSLIAHAIRMKYGKLYGAIMINDIWWLDKDILENSDGLISKHPNRKEALSIQCVAPGWANGALQKYRRENGSIIWEEFDEQKIEENNIEGAFVIQGMFPGGVDLASWDADDKYKMLSSGHPTPHGHN